MLLEPDTTVMLKSLKSKTSTSCWNDMTVRAWENIVRSEEDIAAVLAWESEAVCIACGDCSCHD